MHKGNVNLMELFMRTGRLLHQSHHSHDKKCNAACRGQGRVLTLLKTQPQISQKELASLLDIRSQSLGELLVRLEKSGCIRRMASKEDQRAIDIELTPQGLDAAERAEKLRLSSAQIFDCLSTEEKNQLNHILCKLMAKSQEEAQ